MSKAYVFLLAGAAIFASNASCFSFDPTAFTRLERCGKFSGLKQSKMNLSPVQDDRPPMNRRAVLGSVGAMIAGSLLNRVAPAAAKLDPRPPSPDDQLVYFGAGCFWHVQVIEYREGSPIYHESTQFIVIFILILICKLFCSTSLS